jgi:hypothetical protein
MNTTNLFYNSKLIGVKTILEGNFNLITMTDGRIYKQSKNTELCYKEDTPNELCNVIDSLFNKRERVVIDYGNTATKESWNEVHDIKGRIGRSTGVVKIPLLVYNSRSYGGGALSDNSILSIKSTKGGDLIYQVK